MGRIRVRQLQRWLRTTVIGLYFSPLSCLLAKELPSELSHSFSLSSKGQTELSVAELIPQRRALIQKGLDEFENKANVRGVVLESRNKSAKNEANEEIQHLKNMITLLKEDLARKEKEIQDLQKSLKGAFFTREDTVAMMKQFNEKMPESTMPTQGIFEGDARANALVYEELGTAYVQAKQYQKAKDAYVKSAELNPDNAGVYYYLGLLYQYVEGDSESALGYLRTYLQFAPDGKYNEKAKRLIRILE